MFLYNTSRLLGCCWVLLGNDRHNNVYRITVFFYELCFFSNWCSSLSASKILFLNCSLVHLQFVWKTFPKRSHSWISLDCVFQCCGISFLKIVKVHILTQYTSLLLQALLWRVGCCSPWECIIATFLIKTFFIITWKDAISLLKRLAFLWSKIIVPIKTSPFIYF